jgi:hypothetical protein
MTSINKLMIDCIYFCDLVATGNWGCGAFGGDARLKSLLQLIVCTVIERPIVYFTFGDEQLRQEVYELFLFCKNHQITAGNNFKLIKFIIQLTHFSQDNCINIYWNLAQNNCYLNKCMLL